MVTFDYDDDRIYKVLVRPKYATQLEFHPGEMVTYVSSGDKTDFVITVPASRAFIEVKPKWDDIATNLLVVTNRHTYHVELQATGEARKWYARVAWNYEEGAGLDATALREASADSSVHHAGSPARDVIATGVALDHINSNYAVTGEAPFKPIQVFDDGIRTYVRLPDQLQELPALFMLTPDSGEMALVNYAVNSDYIVVQRLMDRFVLQLGRSQVQVSRTPQRGSRPWSRPAMSGRRFDHGDLGDRIVP